MSRVPNPRGTPTSGFVPAQDAGWAEYSRRKYAWIKAHPDATSREIDRAARKIADELGL
jgi:hypothetical protein